jgi:NAD(P)-dependent dehydrogenase (short-subunit alcohol dehydrogenase family)
MNEARTDETRISPTAGIEEHVVIIGGSSGMGLALAETMLAGGAHVTIVGRDPGRLDAAAGRLTAERPADGRLAAVAADVSDEDDVRALFEKTGRIDHVVTTAADATGAYQPITGFDLGVGRRLLDSKIVGAFLLAKHAAPNLARHGSLTFTSGIAAYRPAAGGSMVATVNGALESLAAALALELAPIRVNVVSPGWIETPIWDAIPGRQERLAAMAERLPVGRIGAPRDVAQAMLAVIRNEFITGTVLHVDGGHRFV